MKKAELWLWWLCCIHVLEFKNFNICWIKSDLLTLELLYIVDVLVSIDAGAQVAIILLAFGPSVVIVDVGTGLYLG